ncbi:hypothetical protein F4779DRAFT_337971 [Xylariaceae sp. FL0662B]|nr:hypothetical protein F4779DRAFT_337971 [Xylariaceae sp. FL0662B]
MADNEAGKHCCGRCGKAKQESEMRRCPNCEGTYYCNRTCQRADYKNHQNAGCARDKSASANEAAPSIAAPTGNTRSTGSSSRNASSGALRHTVSKPFTLLDKGTYLHDRPEEDVYKLLIDSYRLRMDDTAKFDGIREPDSLYGGASDGLRGFQGFLAKAKARPNLLPPWWKDDKQAECEALGNGSGWSSLRNKIDKGNINSHYRDDKFAMQLRMLAEDIYGRGIGGANGTGMRQMMVAMESGRGPPVTSFLSM